MKIRILIIMMLIFGIEQANAQFSFRNMQKKTSEQAVGDQTYNKKEMEIVLDSLTKIGNLNKDNIIISLNKKYGYEDFQDGISANRKGDKKLSSWLFPAFVKGSEAQAKRAIEFFEGNNNHQKFFQSNNVLYNPNLKNMTLNSEIINDYFGGFRVGMGFQINSVLENESLSVEEVDKNKLISSLQNSGGNVYVNLKFPILAIGNTNSSFGLKSVFYHNTGVELTKFNQADSDFMMTNMTGIVIGGFGNGAQGKISAFVQAKAGIIYGNSKFKNILSVNEKVANVIPLTHFEIGINFSGLYTLKIETYPLGSYIKDNFPTTISFVITPNNE